MVVIEGGKKDEPGKEEASDMLSESSEDKANAGSAKGLKKFLNRGKDK
jgi:hypothetical protein